MMITQLGKMAAALCLLTPFSDPKAQMAAPTRRVVDLAICLDTSGSMNGLIDAARQSIWAIVNDLALATPAPRLRLALLTFGNDGHKKENGWVRVDTKFTEDLDLVSQKLFALRTNGGTEFVGRVLQASLDQLAWDKTRGALKLIVVAGNESADQDKLVNFRAQCKRAISQGIMINSIYCGNPSDRLAPVWRDVAILADGKFAAINQNGTVALQSPFDAQISSLSSSLNKTYIPIGTQGRIGAANQVEQDKNAAKMNSKAAAQRGQSKSTANYRCSWDLVDCLSLKTLKIEEVKVADLPQNMRKMTMEQRKKYVGKMRKQRAAIQKQINDLNGKRQVWASAERKKLKLDSSKDFEHVVRKAVRQQAKAKGLSFPEKKKLSKPKAKKGSNL